MNDRARHSDHAWDRFFEEIRPCDESVTNEEVRAELECLGIDMTAANRALHKMVAEQQERTQAGWSEWVQSFPLREMRRLGFSLLADRSDADALLQFFGVTSPSSWHSAWRATAVAYRQTQKFTTREHAIAAWVRETEFEASKLDVAQFDEQRLWSSLRDLRQLTRKRASEILDPVQSICAAAGVAVVLVPALPKTCISGCARWLRHDRALVGLTLRHKTDDQLWFTLFHEIGHILLHRYDQAFVVDNADTSLVDGVVDPEMERCEAEANRFAADTLIPPDALDAFMERQSFTSESIHNFAEMIGVGPGIVVGRLQHEKVLEWYQGRKLKQSIDWGIESDE